MSILSQEEQHEARNAVVAMKGHIRKLRTELSIPDQDYALLLARLKKIDNVLNNNIKYLEGDRGEV